jgi:uncharacterized membrane protein
MALLAVAVAAFAALHLVPAIPPLKGWLADRLGAGYGFVFGGGSTIALVLIVLGWRWSAFIPVYEPSPGARPLTFALTFIAALGLGIFLFRGQLRQRLRFPLALATIAWALGHLLSNGDLASLILFGGLGVYGLAHLACGMAYGLRPSAEVRQGHDLLSILAGIALFGVMTQLHGTLIGVPVVSLS